MYSWNIIFQLHCKCPKDKNFQRFIFKKKIRNQILSLKKEYRYFFSNEFKWPFKCILDITLIPEKVVYWSNTWHIHLISYKQLFPNLSYPWLWNWISTFGYSWSTLNLLIEIKVLIFSILQCKIQATVALVWTPFSTF